MASMPKTNRTHVRIVEIRNRARFRYRAGELAVRLGEIEHAYDSISADQTELLRYFPITLIASVESFIRMAVKDLIDHGEPFLSNAESLVKKDKFDYDALKNMHGKVVTIGEIVAHQIQVSAISHTIANISTLMGDEFKDKLATVRDRWEVEVNGKPDVPIISDIDTTLRHVAETFRLRHIFCHEIASAVPVVKENIDKCVEHTVLFLLATEQIIADTLFPDAPLTQSEMNRAAASERNSEKAILGKLILEAENVLSPEQRRQLGIANTAWEGFLNASVEIEGLFYKGGSIRPTIEAGAATQLTAQRQKHIRELISHATQV